MSMGVGVAKGGTYPGVKCNCSHKIHMLEAAETFLSRDVPQSEIKRTRIQTESTSGPHLTVLSIELDNKKKFCTVG